MNKCFEKPIELLTNIMETKVYDDMYQNALDFAIAIMKRYEAICQVYVEYQWEDLPSDTAFREIVKIISEKMEE